MAEVVDEKQSTEVIDLAPSTDATADPPNR